MADIYSLEALVHDEPALQEPQATEADSSAPSTAPEAGDVSRDDAPDPPILDSGRSEGNAETSASSAAAQTPEVIASQKTPSSPSSPPSPTAQPSHPPTPTVAAAPLPAAQSSPPSPNELVKSWISVAQTAIATKLAERAKTPPPPPPPPPTLFPDITLGDGMILKGGSAEWLQFISNAQLGLAAPSVPAITHTEPPHQ